MSEDITPQQIKEIRQRYGLSQQAFARVLGLGEASIVRYENGQKPSRANANLIRAAAIPSFMADCLKCDGHLITDDQRAGAERIVYADVTFKEDGDMDINEVYTLTLKQEVLNEKAADIMAELFRAKRAAERVGDSGLVMMYEDMAIQLALLKPTIATEANMDMQRLCAIDGQLDCMREIYHQTLKRAA